VFDLQDGIVEFRERFFCTCDLQCHIAAPYNVLSSYNKTNEMN